MGFVQHGRSTGVRGLFFIGKQERLIKLNSIMIHNSTTGEGQFRNWIINVAAARQCGVDNLQPQSLIECKQLKREPGKFGLNI